MQAQTTFEAVEGRVKAVGQSSCYYDIRCLANTVNCDRRFRHRWKFRYPKDAVVFLGRQCLRGMASFISGGVHCEKGVF